MAIEDTVKEFLVDHLRIEPKQVVPEAVLEDAEEKGGLGADSLDAVELILAFEEEFDISIEDEDVHKIKTVGDIVAYVKSKVPEGVV